MWGWLCYSLWYDWDILFLFLISRQDPLSLMEWACWLDKGMRRRRRSWTFHCSYIEEKRTASSYLDDGRQFRIPLRHSLGSRRKRRTTEEPTWDMWTSQPIWGGHSHLTPFIKIIKVSILFPTPSGAELSHCRASRNGFDRGNEGMKRTQTHREAGIGWSGLSNGGTSVLQNLSMCIIHREAESLRLAEGEVRLWCTDK